MIPVSVDLFGHKIITRFTKEVQDPEKEGRRCLGLADYNLKQIQVALTDGDGGDIPLTVLEETWLHELIHHIDDMMGIGLKERQVTTLAVGLHEFLRRNDCTFRD